MRAFVVQTEKFSVKIPNGVLAARGKNRSATPQRKAINVGDGNKLGHAQG